ncbi:hypothetical protein B0H17DRAFT_1144961 [Mycena rosella]|uniref:Uncharacterized protein n=1 Tax=Mycena rosella TaxID=1033263 RepID=A0AAD7CRZ6_MYCRO|nr:hypothetical protein B0H17DRAFT_1144961 [Mycena rosella]
MSRGPKGYTMEKISASGRFGSCSKQVVTKRSAPYDKEDNVIRLIQTTLAVVGGTVDEVQGHQSRPGDPWDQPESGLLEELLWLEGSSMLAASVKTLKSRKLEGCVITRLKLESQFRDTTGRESTAVKSCGNSKKKVAGTQMEKKTAGTQLEEKKLRELKLKKKLWELNKKKKVVGMPSSRKFSWPTQNEAKTCGNCKKELKKLRE